MSGSDTPLPFATDAKFQFYVVAFVDLLNQSDKLVKLEVEARRSLESAETLRLVDETILTTLRVRRMIIDTFERLGRFSHPGQVEPDFKGMTELRLPIFTYGFGDSFVLATPIDEDARWPDQIAAVHAVLVTAGALVLEGLASGHAVRGAVDCGHGLKLSSDEILGPVVASAYHLERKAGHPRIVIGEGLLEFLDSFRDRSADTPELALAQSFVRLCRQRCFRDNDGRVVVDYLGEELVALERESLCAMARRAYPFVQSETRRFSDAGDAKHQAMFERVGEYFDSRRQAWAGE
jgi:hypothetical protein